MLNIITALKAEAAPIIAGLSLKPLPLSADYCIFSGHGVRLGISGMGCDKVGILTDYFLAQNNPAYRHETVYWLNFGMAGSAVWKIGELVLAKTVTEQSTGKIWTLGLGINSGINFNLPTGHICTVQSPQAICQGNKVYDMEASGMVSLLSERNLLEHTFIVKIISDGPSRPLESLTKHDLQHTLNDRKKEILAITRKIYAASLETVISR